MTATTLIRAFTCGAAALALTAIFSLSFVHSTAQAPWGITESSSPVMAHNSTHQRHVLFGQSLPAVLVD
ncbi:MAG TPA: hypothetical protein VIY54_11765 [Steroidobacteraceae bacterium]